MFVVLIFLDLVVLFDPVFLVSGKLSYDDMIGSLCCFEISSLLFMFRLNVHCCSYFSSSLLWCIYFIYHRHL